MLMSTGMELLILLCAALAAILAGMSVFSNSRPPDARIEARSLRHRPADQHAVYLQPKVVMQAASAVPLHDESATRQRCTAHGAARLGCPGKVAFMAVLIQAHVRRVDRAGRRVGTGAPAANALRLVTPPRPKLRPAMSRASWRQTRTSRASFAGGSRMQSRAPPTDPSKPSRRG